MSTEWDPKDFNKNLQKTKERKMLDSVLIVELKAKQLCPKKTSHLASTITHQQAFTLTGYSGFVLAGGQSKFGTIVDYAVYQELGTKYMAGRFYMQGGLISSYPELRAIWRIR